MVTMFTDEVAVRLGFYVYRLIDPRNGETFYVGKGKGNRVFTHVRDELGVNEDALTEKLQRIREIRKDGFEVAHVIHRHGLDERTALEVEAALIDAYPEADNIADGRSSGERGLMHSRQIIERYAAPEAVFRHAAILITVNRSVTEKASVYEAVRYAWKLDPKKARRASLIMAVERGLIIGVFVADRWLAATPENFPGTVVERPGRWGFVGREAATDVARSYVRHRLPDAMRKPGAANPVRYIWSVGSECGVAQ
jgi:hypothetical protein